MNDVGANAMNWGGTDRALNSLIFNSAILYSEHGRLREAAEMMGIVARLDSTSSEISLAASRLSFQVADYESSRQHLARAKQLGAPALEMEEMDRVLSRAECIGSSDHLDSLRHANENMAPRGLEGCLLAFCDWLENRVHEYCQDTRSKIAARNGPA